MSENTLEFNGAGGGTRTPDPRITKTAAKKHGEHFRGFSGAGTSPEQPKTVDFEGVSVQKRAQAIRGKVSLCRTCGEVFTTVSGFDRHRVGKHDLTAPHYGRRCLTADELIAAGFIRNRLGRWARVRLSRAPYELNTAIGGGPVVVPRGGG